MQTKDIKDRQKPSVLGRQDTWAQLEGKKTEKTDQERWQRGKSTGKKYNFSFNIHNKPCYKSPHFYGPHRSHTISPACLSKPSKSCDISETLKLISANLSEDSQAWKSQTFLSETRKFFFLFRTSGHEKHLKAEPQWQRVFMCLPLCSFTFPAKKKETLNFFFPNGDKSLT